MAPFIKRPGGPLATRPLYFFWIVDCSGSMYGEKIGAVNTAIEETIPEMRSAADNNPEAQLYVRVLKFSSGAEWVTAQPEPIKTFTWKPLDVGGLTDLGKALNLLADQLDLTNIGERALPPVLVLLSDGQPTSEYKTAISRLLHSPWGKRAVRIAISIGRGADDDMLAEFTGNKEMVLQANNSKDLVNAIRWSSTLAAVVSTPASRRVTDGGDAQYIATPGVTIDASTMPVTTADTDSDSDDVW